jgi:putative tryptophan/tyrosine transport system substrate-binding protein
LIFFIICYCQLGFWWAECMESGHGKKIALCLCFYFYRRSVMKRGIAGLLIAIVCIGVGAMLTPLLRPEIDGQKKFVVGVINPNPGTVKIQQGFIKGLEGFGYKEGENVTFIQYTGISDIEKSIQHLRSVGVDLIFTVTTPATKRVQKVFEHSQVPVVFTVFDPVKSGVINSLAHPGGNLTGIQLGGSSAKALEWLVGIQPDMKKIFVPVKFDTKATKQSLFEMGKSAESLGVELNVVEINNEKELKETLASLPSDIDAMFITHSIFISSHVKELVQMSVQRKLPSGAAIGKAQEGILVSYSPRLFEAGRQASRLANLVFQGRKIDEIPSEMAHFSLEFNLKTADAAGVEIPNDMLLLADAIHR